MKKSFNIEKVSKDNFTVTVTKVEGNADCTINNKRNLAVYNVTATINYKGIPVDTINELLFTERFDNELIKAIKDRRYDVDLFEVELSDSLDKMLEVKLKDGFSLNDIFGNQVMYLYMKSVHDKLYHIGSQYFTTYDWLLQNFQSLYCLLYRDGSRYRLMFHHDTDKLNQKAMKLLSFEP